MNQVALIKYSFLFKPGTETWTRGVEFENDLAKYFASCGLKAEVAETWGGSGERVIMISPIEKEPLPQPASPSGKIPRQAGR